MLNCIQLTFYFSMAAYFDRLGLKGFANWMKVQTLEELTHANKFYEFINEREGSVKLAALQAPPTEWEKPLDAFNAALEHERYITKRINELADLAEKEKDRPTTIFLQWFVTEQVEEEAFVGEVVDKLKLTESAPNALFMIDRELAQRQFVPPQQEQ